LAVVAVLRQGLPSSVVSIYCGSNDARSLCSTRIRSCSRFRLASFSCAQRRRRALTVSPHPGCNKLRFCKASSFTSATGATIERMLLHTGQKRWLNCAQTEVILGSCSRVASIQSVLGRNTARSVHARLAVQDRTRLPLGVIARSLSKRPLVLNRKALGPGDFAGPDPTADSKPKFQNQWRMGGFPTSRTDITGRTMFSIQRTPWQSSSAVDESTGRILSRW
jgi:hypothetical protein